MDGYTWTESVNPPTCAGAFGVFVAAGTLRAVGFGGGTLTAAERVFKGLLWAPHAAGVVAAAALTLDSQAEIVVDVVDTRA